MTKNRGSAEWNGPIKEGKGFISTKKGALDQVPYGFKSRFEEGPGTNPEELIGAAHAACFSMALSLELGERGIDDPSIKTTSDVELQEKDGGFAITSSHLTISVKASGADEAKMKEAVETAVKNCPVSKLLDCEITHQASYES